MAVFTKSIRCRLCFWLGFLLICILSGFGITAYQLNRINRFNQLDEELKKRVAAVSMDFRGRAGTNWQSRFSFKDKDAFDSFRQEPRDKPPGELSNREPFDGESPHLKQHHPGPRDHRFSRKPDLLPETMSLFQPDDKSGYYFVIWNRRGNVWTNSSNLPAQTSFPERTRGDTRARVRTVGMYREAFHFTEMDDCILAGRTITPELAAINLFGWCMAGAGAAILALGLGGVWLLATRTLKPVRDISFAANRIAQGNLSERINIADTDSELGYLAGVLNCTFARLESAFAEQKQFTANASHELRTPLAVMISEAQTTLARERTAAEYRETVEACLDTAQQMRRLTESLLELARFDAGQEVIQRKPFDLAGVARGSVDLVQPLAGERKIQIQCDLAPAEVRGDADRIGQVITNLLTNAINYNKEGGSIEIVTSNGAGASTLTVSDTGQGIALEDLPRVFDRFYRADKSRGGTSGRVGLGLAICKTIIEAHGGSIEVQSQPGEGTRFTVRLP